MHMPLDILLVEDNQGDVEMIRHALKTAHLKSLLVVTNNGDQALHYLKSEQGLAAPPKLILLDMNMPKMGGKQFLSSVKADPKLKAIPVVMFTSSQSPDDIRDCYERQASLYVVKPFDIHEYAAAIHQVVGLWGGPGQLPI